MVRQLNGIGLEVSFLVFCSPPTLLYILDTVSPVRQPMRFNLSQEETANSSLNYGEEANLERWAMDFTANVKIFSKSIWFCCCCFVFASSSTSLSKYLWSQIPKFFLQVCRMTSSVHIEFLFYRLRSLIFRLIKSVASSSTDSHKLIFHCKSMFL